MKVRLQIGLATVFTLLTAVLLGIVVSFLYFGNRELALRTAQNEMTKSRTQSVENMLATIRGTARAVTSAASFIGEFPEQAKSLGGLDVLHGIARGNEHYYGLYFGVEATGAFYQNVLLSRETKTFGPNSTQVPETATRVLRIIDGSLEQRKETYFWSNEAGDATAFFEKSPTYDPRERPWYRGAMESNEVFITQPYRFESTGRPGVTFAQRVSDETGAVIGVIGIDMTMSTLSRILEDIRIGEHGLVFMLDRDGKLMSYTGTRSSGQGTRFVTSDTDEKVEIESEVVETAISRWREDREAFFDFAPSADGEIYIASVAPIPEIFGVRPTLGFVVPEDEFVGPIKQTTARALQISGFVLIIAIVSTIIVARLLSNSLRRVAEEARRISNFELGGDLNLRTMIQEVSELETAMSSMKAGLASFGAYVPKDLVRSIVSRGEMIGVGGTSREVTLLFSDLRGFTSRTESLEPEELMPALSQYFEAMEKEIAVNAGSVDKYIGDAIMAMWNAPLDDPKHAEHACRAALACLHAEEGLNNTNVNSSPLVPLHTRFGLHTGRVIVGNVGSLSRMQYTALGAVVNLASRTESLNKAYGTRILVSDDLAQKVSDIFLFREVDTVSPVGTSKPTRLFELIGEADDTGRFPVSATRKREVEDWNACYALYRARSWAAAIESLTAYQHTASNPVLAETYIKRCREFIANPPADDWDGVYSFNVK